MVDKRCWLLLCLAAMFLTVGGPGPSAGEPKPGGKLLITYGGGTPRHFNPAVQSGTSTAIVGTQIFASPLRYDENWNPRPYLAKSWTVSKDGRSVTLNLVEGAVFHDGRPVTSEDVAFSILTVKEHHPFKSMFAPVVAVDTPDPHTAVIRLAHPHPAILLAMSPALLPILPRHVYGDGQDIKTHPANLKPVGSGPFQLVRYDPGKTIVLRKNDAYFLPGRPYLDEIEIRLENDPMAQVIDTERQEAQLLPAFMDVPGLDRLSQNSHLVVTQKGYEGIGSIVWLAFNLLRKPLNDRRVRQAIAYAMDTEFIIRYLHQGRSRRAPGPVSPDSPFFYQGLTTYPFDLEKAGKLLDEAGYPMRSDGKRFSVTLDYIPVLPSQFRDVALYLQQQLAKVGIVVQVRRSKDFSEWATRIGNWDFDMTMDSVYNWGDPVIGVHRTYLSDNIRKGVIWSNTQNYRNRRVDEVLVQAGTEMDRDKRKDLYREFQQIITDELPGIWINMFPFHTIYHRGLGNPPVSIWGIHAPLDEVYWRNPPVRRFVPTPTLDENAPLLEQTGIRAIRLLRENGLYDALEILKDPARGFLDLQGSGLHIIGFTQGGTVFLDTSGQMKPGIDMSGILDLEGKSMHSRFLEAAQAKNGHWVQSRGAWPHPGTHRTGTLTAWCGMLTEADGVCAMQWETETGDPK